MREAGCGVQTKYSALRIPHFELLLILQEIPDLGQQLFFL